MMSSPSRDDCKDDPSALRPFPQQLLAYLNNTPASALRPLEPNLALDRCFNYSNPVGRLKRRNRESKP